MVKVIAQNCKHVKVLILENMFETSPDLLFEHCKDLEEITITSDECDIAVDGVTNQSIETLAANTNGNLVLLNLNACISNVTHEALAKLIKKSPKLESLVFRYEMYNLEDMGKATGPSPAVKALLEHKKKYKKINMNYLNKKDKETIKGLIAKGDDKKKKKKKKGGDDDDEGGDDDNGDDEEEEEQEEEDE